MIAYLKAVPRLEDVNGLGILNIPTIRHLPVRHLALGDAHPFECGFRFGRIVPQSDP